MSDEADPDLSFDPQDPQDSPDVQGPANRPDDFDDFESDVPQGTKTSPWGHVKIAEDSEGNVRDYRAALGDTAFVTRDKRNGLDAKDLEKLVKNMLTPFPDKEKFDKVVLPDLASISTIQNTASVAELLSKVSSHFTAYDLNLSFLAFPKLDLTDKKHPTWDRVSTINIFESYDQITVEEAAITVAWMRQYIVSDTEIVKELTWTHHFLLGCCSDENGEGSFARKIRGETDSIRSDNMLKFGGPLTLVIMLKHISSSSEKALKALQTAIPKVKITDVPGEDITFVCNSLGYVLRRLDLKAMPHLSSDLLGVFQTSSHEDFNDVFKTWRNYVLLQKETEPSWTEILARARALYDEFSDSWVAESNANKSIFNAASTGTKSASTEDGSWKKSPWLAFPNAANGDVCTVIDNNKQWTKKISTSSGEVKHAKWCGKCFSKKHNRRGMWRDGPLSHFTHEHGANSSANVATTSSGDAPVETAPAPAPAPSALRTNVSFSQALQQAAEGN